MDKPKTAASRRTLELDAETTLALATLKGQQHVLKESAVYWETHDLVFCTHLSTLLNPNNLYRNFARIRQDAGLDETWSIHSLRHSHATHLLLSGVPLEVVSRRLGHANSSITLNTYSHLLPGYEEAAVAAIERALYGVPELEG